MKTRSSANAPLHPRGERREAETKTQLYRVGVEAVVMPDLDILEALFIEQFGELCTGGFENPTVEHDDGNDIIFRCFYNNYDNEDDAWHYGFDRKTGKFYAA